MNAIVSQKPPTDVSITKIESFFPEMIREIAELEILVYDRSPDEIDQEIEVWEERFRRIPPEERACFMAHKDGVLIGFSGVRQINHETNEWWLLNAIVHPDYRRQGIGTRMAEMRIEYAKTQGANIIRSDARMDNMPSRLYFRSMGFISEGSWVPEVSLPETLSAANNDAWVDHAAQRTE